METKANILIVDDEQVVRTSLTHWFREDNYNVLAAEDAETALKIFEKSK